MVKLTFTKVFTALFIVLIAPLTGRPANGGSAPSSTLFSQSASEALDRNFPSKDISFLLLDARTGQMLASRWEHPETPIPLGSLSKPFAALAYGRHHQFNFPIHTCQGKASGCWRPNGHGPLQLSAAITYSCNSYFRVLAADLNSSEVADTALQFGLEPPDQGTSGAALAGLGPEWRTSPAHMAEAYVELLRERQQPGVSQILDGMAGSAHHGTASALDRALHSANALAKTGTAPCTHTPHAPGDGFTVALIPADNPRLLLLVRVHGVPGSVAALTAGQMLQRIKD